MKLKLKRYINTAMMAAVILVLIFITRMSVNGAGAITCDISLGNIVITAGTGINAGKIAVTHGTPGSTEYVAVDSIIIIMSTAPTTANTIKVEPGTTGVNIILHNVNVDVSTIYNACAFDIGDGAVVTLALDSGTVNSFKSGAYKAGIKVETPVTGTPGSITINGPGELIANGGKATSGGGSGAGIGSNGTLSSIGTGTPPSAGNITINSGTIQAIGGEVYDTFYSGAGIGGGGAHGGISTGCNGGFTTIHGGTILAVGGRNPSRFSGAGIGGGSGLYAGNPGTILIDGGIVTAKSGDANWAGNAIGYGYSNAAGGERKEPASITITGTAVVNALAPVVTASAYGSIGHSDLGNISIGGTAVISATAVNGSLSDAGAISCNTLNISDSPCITVLSTTRQGNTTRISLNVEVAIKPIFAKSITSTVPIFSGVFPGSFQAEKTIVVTGGDTPNTRTLTLPVSYASFATTVGSAGTYSGSVGIDLLKDMSTNSLTFNISSLSSFNVKAFDITPPTAPEVPTASVGPDINIDEATAGVEVALSLGTSGAVANDVAELLIEGVPFSTPITHILTADEISAGSCILTIPLTSWGADGSKSITARVTDETGNVGAAGASLTLNVDLTAPTAPVTVTVIPIGGTVTANTLNTTTTNMTATAAIAAAQATGGKAELYIGSILKATDNTILAGDVQVTFNLGQSTVGGLQSAVPTGGVVSVKLFDSFGNVSASIADNPTLTVDYTVPEVVSVSVPAAGVYKAGEMLGFTVNFNENIDITGGVPYIQLALSTGVSVRASYMSGSGTSSLVFVYVVSAGNEDYDGVEVSSESINLNGSTIRDQAKNDAGLTLHNIGATSGIKIDTVIPTISSVSVPAAGTYKVGQALTFIVNFSENVTVDTANGIPSIPMIFDTGGAADAIYAGGSGTNTWIFDYIVFSGDLDFSGIEIGSVISGNGGSIRDAGANEATLTLNSIGSTSAVNVDGIIPAVTINQAAGQADPTKGETINFSVVFSEPVTEFSTGDCILSGSSGATAAVVTGSGATYNVAVSGMSTTGTVIVSIGAGVAQDAAGNTNSASVSGDNTVIYDATAPIPGAGGSISADADSISTILLAWALGTDNLTSQANLMYKIVRSADNNIGTVETALLNGAVVLDWSANISSLPVTELVSATTYYFTVIVKDEAGNAAIYSTVCGATRPAAPATGLPAPGNTFIDISWNSVERAEGYKLYIGTQTGVYSLPVISVDSAATTYRINGLVNGIPHYIMVMAIAHGVESVGSCEVSTTPRTVPQAPVTISAVPNSGAATISFSAPLDDGGSDITHYIVTSEPDGITKSSTGTTVTVTGLTNGTLYTFTVKTVNEAGMSADSEHSNSVLPYATSIPEIHNVTEGDQSVHLEWSEVAGSTGYYVYISSDPGSATGAAIPVNDTCYTVTGLTNGTAYYFRVSALNPEGESPASAEACGTPRTVPGAPTNVTATAGYGSATIKFIAPVDNGGDAITQFIVTSNPGGITAVGTETTITVEGLTIGTLYTFLVKAVNEAGDGQESVPSNGVTPFMPSAGASTGNIIPVSALTDASGNTKASVTPEAVNRAIEQAIKQEAAQGDGAVSSVVVKVDAPPDSKAVGVSIPQASINAAASSTLDELTVSTSLGNITFDQDSISSIALEAAEDVLITISRVNAGTLTAEAQKVVGDRPVYSFSVTSGGSIISHFDGDVRVTVPYSPKNGEDISAIVIYYINAEGKPELMRQCSYDPETGTISFKTNHFSQYAIGHNKVVFQDVDQAAWYSGAVSFLAARNIIMGTSVGNFDPEIRLTRGQFITIIMRAYEIAPAVNPADNFTDAGDTYYTGFLAAAKQLKLSVGVGDNRFAPEREITRQEMFTLLYNILKKLGDLPKTSTGMAVADFGDLDVVSDWAKDAVTLFIKTGVISGSNGRICPTVTASRAEMAQLLYNLLTK